ncbi:hypothetical protein M427DRAFT_44097 [Gonapodya prolifera JEL478]|uniref:Uncharacterized protein n=1 Tax=Gonapodya prolifera (strain JEL478) TaxID=1344416 RepID=A0A139AGI8_GONPJ|nr:hypothetical protein M427DRAFT_44097 [Gonapodya prolifera JEL478]|eukprot:KXS15916.1 hypothetical protein M427DRAFT_44097 [Gonapodya prolifera JEL478]
MECTNSALCATKSTVKYFRLISPYQFSQAVSLFTVSQDIFENAESIIWELKQSPVLGTQASLWSHIGLRHANFDVQAKALYHTVTCLWDCQKDTDLRIAVTLANRLMWRVGLPFEIANPQLEIPMWRERTCRSRDPDDVVPIPGLCRVQMKVLRLLFGANPLVTPLEQAFVLDKVIEGVTVELLLVSNLTKRHPNKQLSPKEKAEDFISKPGDNVRASALSLEYVNSEWEKILVCLAKGLFDDLCATGEEEQLQKEQGENDGLSTEDEDDKGSDNGKSNTVKPVERGGQSKPAATNQSCERWSRNQIEAAVLLLSAVQISHQEQRCHYSSKQPIKGYWELKELAQQTCSNPDIVDIEQWHEVRDNIPDNNITVDNLEADLTDSMHIVESTAGIESETQDGRNRSGQMKSPIDTLVEVETTIPVQQGYCVTTIVTSLEVRIYYVEELVLAFKLNLFAIISDFKRMCLYGTMAWLLIGKREIVMYVLHAISTNKSLDVDCAMDLSQFTTSVWLPLSETFQRSWDDLKDWPAQWASYLFEKLSTDETQICLGLESGSKADTWRICLSMSTHTAPEERSSAKQHVIHSHWAVAKALVEGKDWGLPDFYFGVKHVFFLERQYQLLLADFLELVWLTFLWDTTPEAPQETMLAHPRSAAGYHTDTKPLVPASHAFWKHAMALRHLVLHMRPAKLELLESKKIRAATVAALTKDFKECVRGNNWLGKQVQEANRAYRHPQGEGACAGAL